MASPRRPTRSFGARPLSFPLTWSAPGPGADHFLEAPVLALPAHLAIVAAEPDHARFARALPLVEAVARDAFCIVRCPHARADLVAESAALAWKLFRDGHSA